MGRKIGIIVNPVAGLGGRVGLKGSDGQAVQARARELGARPEAPQRAVTALKELVRSAEPVECLAYPGEMGEQEAREAGLDPAVIGKVPTDGTSAEDTRRAAQEMADQGADLILFAGGDGTARDIYSALGDGPPVLGIPTGVKMHSGVFAGSPARAGRLAADYLAETGRDLELRAAEVLDIDEEAFRQGRVSAKLYGYLRIPFARNMVQGPKVGSCAGEAQALAAIGADIVAGMEPDRIYLIGAGTTTKAVMDHLGLATTLLGVDAVRNREPVGVDLNERLILETINRRRAAIVVGVIGAQGYIFGRGNQQLSDRVIKKVGSRNILVLATMEKLVSLDSRPLMVDTGDPVLDRELSGYRQVITGVGERVVARVES